MRMLEMELLWRLMGYYFKNEEKLNKAGIHNPRAFMEWVSEVLFRDIEKRLDKALRKRMKESATYPNLKKPKVVPPRGAY